jgi:dienelactone hydrolase
MKTAILPIFCLMLNTLVAQAAVQTKNVDYEYDGTKLKGMLAWDDAATGKRPGVLVVHEFWGLNDYAKERAKKLAALGYVAFACDMYGDGKSTEHPDDARTFAGEVRKNVKVWQGRALAGLKILQDNEHVDAKKIAAIGYCFGGSTCLQLAYSGADVAAIVTFHGALPIPDEAQAKAIKGKILICHGADDSFIPEDTIQKVRAAFAKAGTDYQMIYYANTVHSFTVPDADKKMMKGVAYNEKADRRSWQAMRDLFAEALGK